MGVLAVFGNRLSVLGVALLAVTGLSACGGGTSGDNGILTASAALERLGIDASQIPPEQSEFFADNAITFAEYREAIEGEWKCLDDSGWFTMGPIEYGSDGSLGFTTTYDSGDGPGVDDTVLDSVFQDCTIRYAHATALVWSLLRVPSVEERSQLRPQVISCVNDAGLEILPDATDAQVIEALNGATPLPGDEPAAGIDIEAIRTCAQEFSRYFLVMPPQ